MSGAQAAYARVALADGTLVVTPSMPDEDLIPSLLAVSDVLGTGWYAADAARVQLGATVAVVGDGAVGLMGVLAAAQMGAERIIAMSRHKDRQDLALEYGATDIVSERGEAGVARVREMTQGIGADSALECVGTQQSMMQAIQCGRPGAGPSVPAASDRPGAAAPDQSRQGFRPRLADRRRGRRLSRDG